LLAEAEERVSNELNPQVRFERLRLLEGITRHLAERTDLEDKVAVFRCLVGTIGLTEEEVSSARSEYIAEELLNQGKLRGYGAPIELMSVIQLDLPKDWLSGSAEVLCNRGLLRKTGEDHYVTTNDAWSDEIRLAKAKAEEVDVQLSQILNLRGHRDFRDWHDHYRSALSRALEVGDLLRSLGERKLSEDLNRKTTREVNRLGTHHAGPWLPTQARDYRTYFRNIMQGLPQPLRVEKWSEIE
jgi:hypothetical protein